MLQDDARTLKHEYDDEGYMDGLAFFLRSLQMDLPGLVGFSEGVSWHAGFCWAFMRVGERIKGLVYSECNINPTWSKVRGYP